MRFITLIVCLVGMVLFSSIAMGEIIMVNVDWDGSEENCSGDYVSSSAWASASGDDTDEDGWASGGYGYITTVGGNFHWVGYGDAGAYVGVYVVDQWPCWAWGYGSAGTTHTGESKADIEIDEDAVESPPDWAWDLDDPDAEYDDDDDYFPAYDGIWAGHSVEASAMICSGSDNEAYGEGNAVAVCDLY